MSVFLVFTSEVDQVHGAEGDFGVPASHAPIVVRFGWAGGVALAAIAFGSCYRSVPVGCCI